MNESFFEFEEEKPDYFPPSHQGRKHLVSGDKMPHINPSDIHTSPDEKEMYREWGEKLKESISNIPESEPLKQSSKLTGSQQLRMIAERLRPYNHLHENTQPSEQKPEKRQSDDEYYNPTFENGDEPPF